ncbi:uncharacterized protein BJ171DRAFT_187408 [Polychytrium aggregatum]|uniref:uncharacterized protein n=1 Tax=Polychytrium aggregatum TaxID=110093 RepID=UPI0022FE88AA|nr:uncharacterized protein BJ171DRAFT_187408 [Polychytrium aggregatum]KAI9202204.1 hypothetical protein BJ171DRAFT_187408 [Polychytrium aggregatum]
MLSRQWRITRGMALWPCPVILAVVPAVHGRSWPGCGLQALVSADAKTALVSLVSLPRICNGRPAIPASQQCTSNAPAARVLGKKHRHIAFYTGMPFAAKAREHSGGTIAADQTDRNLEPRDAVPRPHRRRGTSRKPPEGCSRSCLSDPAFPLIEASSGISSPQD